MLVPVNPYFCAMPPVSAETEKTSPARESSGFSMVELLVVVMVILVIAAIAIPSLVHARMKANEAAAVASMKSIQTAESLYTNSYPEEGFSPSLAKLGPNGSDCENPGPNNACIIMDETLTSGMKNGYIFELLGDGKRPSGAYKLTATPESAGFSGSCGFSSSESGEIVRVSPNGSSSGSRLAMEGGSGCQ
jgi:prepilin-type N-terminal cleavage/methylation domain-containing protein